jgi:pimeloyl-ACP methyl ester carboxylesterase
LSGADPATSADGELFPGFRRERIRTRETEIQAVVPVLTLWGEDERTKSSWDPVAVWRDWARDVRGQPVPSGHFLAEEAPAQTLAALEPFLVQ